MRGFYVRRFILPDLLAERRAVELREKRVELSENLLSLRRIVHGLAFLDHDKENAATRIQAWWRALLTLRLANILIIHRQLVDVHTCMQSSAMRIQSVFRGSIARKTCRALRQAKEERELAEQREEERRFLQAVIRIQSAARCMFAMRTANARVMA